VSGGQVLGGERSSIRRYFGRIPERGVGDKRI